MIHFTGFAHTLSPDEMGFFVVGPGQKSDGTSGRIFGPVERPAGSNHSSPGNESESSV
jgi:hypothetical protein